MNQTELKIKRNLLPWYHELDDWLDVYDINFPAAVRTQIISLGDYEIISITNKETILKMKKEAK